MKEESFYQFYPLNLPAQSSRTESNGRSLKVNYALIIWQLKPYVLHANVTLIFKMYYIVGLSSLSKHQTMHFNWSATSASKGKQTAVLENGAIDN